MAALPTHRREEARDWSPRSFVKCELYIIVYTLYLEKVNDDSSRSFILCIVYFVLGSGARLLSTKRRTRCTSCFALLYRLPCAQEEAHDYSPTKFKFFLWNDRALNRLLMVESVMHEMQQQDASGRPQSPRGSRKAHVAAPKPTWQATKCTW